MRPKIKGIQPIDTLHSGKTVVMPRHTAPTEGTMLDDAKYALAAQLAHFRRNANLEEWDSKKATAFQKLVQSLATLQSSEKNAIESFDLGSLSSDELVRLSRQSTRVLAKTGEKRPSGSDSEDE